ncbi:MAG: MFS transporter [Mycobacteriales bacterium]
MELPTPTAVQRTYLLLLLGNTLAASFIWGINTVFLLDAGLSNFQAFAANGFFTAGMVVFEVPTGITADTVGRRASYLLGTVTLAVTTGLYVFLWSIHGPFWAWAVVSIGLGLGFTFFSGAVEAWLVDALAATGFEGTLESVFAKGQIVGGAAMLTGSVAGGYIAQATSLAVPFLIRAAVLVVMFIVAFLLMRDIGFEPAKGQGFATEVRRVSRASMHYGWRVPAVKWLMVSSPFVAGVQIYAFYALQPYLLKLYGNPEAYGIAGLVAAIVAGAQIVGGLAGPRIRKLFERRTTAVFAATAAGAVTLALICVLESFWSAIALIVVWGLLAAAATPVRQAYLNGLIPSQQRATILSFDSMLASSGGVVIQPALGRAADAWSYGASYVASAAITTLALPFILLSRREKAAADTAN